MIVNKCSENLLKKSKKLYENYRDNCTVVQRMLEKYKKIYPNISDYSIMHFIDIAEFCDLIMDRKKLEGLNEDECYCLLLAADHEQISCFVQCVSDRRIWRYI